MNKLYIGCLLTVIALFAATSTYAEDVKYESSWESLAQHKTPEWLQDAKFGLYAHWGLYSIPAFETEWYGRGMYRLGRDVFKHHMENYGGPSKFGYKDFAPLFKCENYEPADWAKLMKDSGARYAGIALVHHDGFLMWDSDVNRWNVGKMGPKRDIYGELIKEIRKQGLKTVGTFHHMRTFNWYLSTKDSVKRAEEEGWDILDPEYADLYWNSKVGMDKEDFIKEWKAKVKEVVDKYNPDLLWFDGGDFKHKKSQHHVTEILSYYFNSSADKETDVLNKLPSRRKFNFPIEVGTLTFEEGRDRKAVTKEINGKTISIGSSWDSKSGIETFDKCWIDDRRIGNEAWGYVKGMTYRSANVITDGLIDRTARGGGLFLSLSPMADGTIDPPQKRILLDIGKWLRPNGEAIFATRPWKIHAEGDVNNKFIIKRKWNFEDATADDICYTRSKNNKYLYAIALDYPQDGTIKCVALCNETKIAKGGIKSIAYLPTGKKVEYKRTDKDLTITLPADADKDAIAYAFKITPDGELINE